MRSPRLALGLSTCLAVATGAVLLTSSTAAAAVTVPARSLTPARALAPARARAHTFAAGLPGLDLHAFFADEGLSVQRSNGFYAATGPAALVHDAARTLTELGADNTALYTGAGGTGGGIVILTGNDTPEGTDFQVMDMTAANVENNSTNQDAVYSDDSSVLDATVAPGTQRDIKPVDVDFAVYPPEATPPPDNRGLNPDAQFSWGPSVG